ncbi:hypothetical protein AcW1_009960 [Taiwanofungus camphoratus]|nr:hypothetical protein AcV7_005309 [Antrodia cinnamomea]KAI0946519.1 hypothetical protein AcW1_009960 [Antrodia cinnamomea]
MSSGRFWFNRIAHTTQKSLGFVCSSTHASREMSAIIIGVSLASFVWSTEVIIPIAAYSQ